MSIIYDALKKVQKNGPERPKEKEGAGKQGLRSYLVYALALCFGIALASFLFRFAEGPFTGKPKPPAEALPASVVAVPAQPLPGGNELTQPHESQAVAKEGDVPALVLNGVFFSQGQAYALVNNTIVKEGDEVEGARLKRISPEEVEFDFNGKAIILSVQGAG